MPAEGSYAGTGAVVGLAVDVVFLIAFILIAKQYADAIRSD